MKEDGVDGISVSRAMYLLEKDGIKVNEEQARAILNFLTLMADIVVAQYLRNRKNKG